MTRRRAAAAAYGAVIPCIAVSLTAGCGGDARVELAAADAIEAIAAQMCVALQEYHQEVEAYDDSREAQAIAAFVARLKADGSDEQKTAADVADFADAMSRLRADRRVEWQRRAAAMENVSLLEEIRQDLQRLAIESLTLRDEARRYLSELVATQQTTTPPVDNCASQACR